MDFHMLHFAVFIFILRISLFQVEAQEYVTVEIAEGLLRGEIRETQTSNSMYSFEGIPYAEPPTGALRFQPPVSKSLWDGIRDALAPGSKCPQDSTVVGDEDCLYLNVYSPAIPSGDDTLKAVMVWIHGGCFTAGEGTIGLPDYFVDSDIVFVSINYRLGLLGFLSTGDGLVPGNMGLKDQTEALRWVQRNIAIFGGDPEQVTIFGESAGAASIHYHILSPLSAGLFRYGIAQSGSALSPWAFSRNATDRAFRFAAHLGHTSQNTADLVNFLLTVDVETLVQDSFSALSEEDSLSLFSCVWAPSIEPEMEGAFLTEEPWDLVSEGRYNYVPYLTGSTDLEMLYISYVSALSTVEGISNLNDNFDEIVACDLRLPTREEQLIGANEVRDFYYGDSEITLENNYTTALFQSHLFFIEGVDSVVRSMATYSSEPIYYYQFSYNGPLSLLPGGASHGDDINYLFATIASDAEGGIIRDQMTAMWANFAKTSNPTPELTSLLTQEWPQYTAEDPAYFNINTPVTVGEAVYEEYMEFWHNLLP